MNGTSSEILNRVVNLKGGPSVLEGEAYSTGYWTARAAAAGMEADRQELGVDNHRRGSQ